MNMNVFIRLANIISCICAAHTEEMHPRQITDVFVFVFVFAFAFFFVFVIVIVIVFVFAQHTKKKCIRARLLI